MRDPQVWVFLEELKREACDQKSILDLAQFWTSAVTGARRRTAFIILSAIAVLRIRRCIESIDILLKLTDFPKAVEVADEYVRARRQARWPFICAAWDFRVSAIIAAP